MLESGPFVASLSPVVRLDVDPYGSAPLTAALEDMSSSERTPEDLAEERAAELAQAVHEVLAAVTFMVTLVIMAALRHSARARHPAPPPPDLAPPPDRLPLSGSVTALAPPAPTTTIRSSGVHFN